MSPAVEKTRSLGTQVAGMERYALASGDSKGYLELFSLHHFRGQQLSGIEINFPFNPAAGLLSKRKSPLVDPQATSIWKQVLSLLTQLQESPLPCVGQ